MDKKLSVYVDIAAVWKSWKLFQNGITCNIFLHLISLPFFSFSLSIISMFSIPLVVMPLCSLYDSRHELLDKWNTSHVKQHAAVLNTAWARNRFGVTSLIILSSKNIFLYEGWLYIKLTHSWKSCWRHLANW